MSFRKILPLAVLVTALAPASAGAATVTVTGDDGNPLPLNPAGPTGIRNVNVEADVTVVPADAAPFYTVQVLDPAGTPAASATSCRDTSILPTSRNFVTYRGNGTYSVVLRKFAAGDENCTGAVRETRYQFTIGAGTSVAAPPGRVLTRAPNSYVTNTYQLGVGLNPGTSLYEVRYALGGVAGPDGAISGPSASTYVDTTTGLAPFRFDKPGRWLIVARAQKGSFNTPWSAPVNVSAVAPFDVQNITFPDARGPSYKLRVQIRERVARGKVNIYLARGKKKGKFRKIGRAKITSKARFSERFTVRRTGIYRLRYTYTGSSLVAGGKVTQQIRIRRRVFFG